MIECLLYEIESKKEYVTDNNITSIYFGGGTPSLLQTNEIEKLLQKIYSVFEVNENIEITLEANPDDISVQKVMEWKQAGINRLSIGIQSFFEEDLQFMNRGHNALQAEKCIEIAIENGIENLSIDLIFGFPLLTHEKWMANIEKVLQKKINHVSCYGMTVEPKTALAHMIAQNKVPNLDNEQSANQYKYLMQTLAENGFEQYEISNFAKPHFEAKHNSSYWNDSHYIGIGPSAHSYNGTSRQWNIANNAKYIEAISKHSVPFDIEYLSREDKLNEEIMISIRNKNGLDLNNFLNKLSIAEREIFKEKIDCFLKEHTMKQDQNAVIVLTTQGKLFADAIASELFL